jgi:hypothetical protein
MTVSMPASMTTIRKFAYAALLAVTSLNFAPSLVSAQERAQGKFTLSHDVRWQNATVPAGEYRFSLGSDGPSSLLVLTKLSGARTGFLLMVHNMDEIKASSNLNRLVLESTTEGSYVRAMQLPEFGVTLNFAEPSKVAEKQMAKVASTTMASAQ